MPRALVRGLTRRSLRLAMGHAKAFQRGSPYAYGIFPDKEGFRVAPVVIMTTQEGNCVSLKAARLVIEQLQNDMRQALAGEPAMVKAMLVLTDGLSRMELLA